MKPDQLSLLARAFAATDPSLVAAAPEMLSALYLIREVCESDKPIYKNLLAGICTFAINNATATPDPAEAKA